MKRIKVLEITPNFRFAQTFIGDRFDYLQQNGYEMHLICSNHEIFSIFVNKHNIQALALDIPRLPNLIKDVRAIISIVRYIRKNNIECIVGHADKGKLLSAIAARITGKHLIIWAHGTPTCFRKRGIKKWFFTLLEKFDSKKAEKVICVSPFVAEARTLHKLDTVEQQVVPHMGSCNGLDCYGQFNPEKIPENCRNIQRNKYGINESDFVIGFCGRFTHDKGIDELVPAFQRLKLEYEVPAKLVMIGEKDIRDDIKQDTKMMINNDSDIICIGFIDHSVIQEVYSMFDLFVLPTHREGLSYVLLENQAMEVPVLTTSITGSRDAIVDGYTGEYIDLKIDDIVAKMAQLYANPDYRLLLGKQAREWICENFETHQVWKNIKEIYDLVLK